MDTKKYQFKDLQFKDGENTGIFTGVFATLNVIDSDGDMTIPGAFGEQKVIISQYNHGSWDRGVAALPIGVGKIFEQGDNAIIEGEFDMEDPAAVATYKKMKYIHSKGRVQEFSYALPEIDYEMRTIDGRNIRVLKRIKVPEVSPVLMGAGVNTRLLDIKSEDLDTEKNEEGKQGMRLIEHIDKVIAEVEDVTKRISDLSGLREEEGRHPSESTINRANVLRSRLIELASGLEQLQIKHNEIYVEHMQLLKSIGGK